MMMPQVIRLKALGEERNVGTFVSSPVLPSPMLSSLKEALEQSQNEATAAAELLEAEVERHTLEMTECMGLVAEELAKKDQAIHCFRSTVLLSRHIFNGFWHCRKWKKWPAPSRSRDKSTPTL